MAKEPVYCQVIRNDLCGFGGKRKKVLVFKFPVSLAWNDEHKCWSNEHRGVIANHHSSIEVGEKGNIITITGLNEREVEDLSSIIFDRIRWIR